MALAKIRSRHVEEVWRFLASPDWSRHHAGLLGAEDLMQATPLRGRSRSLLIFIADGSGIFREDIYLKKKIYLGMVQHTYLETVYISALDSREAKTYPEGSCPHSYAKRLAVGISHVHAAMLQLARMQRVNRRRRGTGMVLG